MSFVPLRGSIPYPAKMWGTGAITSTFHVVDTATEVMQVIGQIQFDDGGAGGSRSITSSGGKFHWRTSAVATFANAGTTLRLGVQDLDTTADHRGDGTFDVYADLVGGTDTIASNTSYETPMETGSKTISHGDWVAIGLEMISKGGSDSLWLQIWKAIDADQAPFPGLVTGTTFLSTNSQPLFMIEFDDGTFGWMASTLLLSASGTVTINSSTATADEYGNLMQVTAPIEVSGVTLALSSAASTADYEVILYSDALGTPVVVEAVVVDATFITSAGQLSFCFQDGPHTLVPGVNYAISVRPTTTNSLSIYYSQVDNMSHWNPSTPPGVDIYAIRRLDNTGAFSDYNGGTAKTRRMHMNLLISGVHDQRGRASFNLGI